MEHPRRFLNMLAAVAAIKIPPPVKIITPQAGTEEQQVRMLFVQFINLFLFVAGALAVIALIVGGLQYIMGSQAYLGERGLDLTSRGRRTVTYAAIGIFIVVFAYAAANYVAQLASK